MTSDSQDLDEAERIQDLCRRTATELWDVPIEELRTRFAIDLTAIAGEAVRAAA